MIQKMYTVIFISSNNINEFVKKVNKDLKAIYNYLCKNKLCINTECMVISNKNVNAEANKFEVMVNVSEIKYLGKYHSKW